MTRSWFPIGSVVATACAVATTSSISLMGEQVIDGVSVQQGDRVLVRAQSNPVQNGVYTARVGAWLRAADFASPVLGTRVYTTGGTKLGEYAVSTESAIVVGTTPIEFVYVMGSVVAGLLPDTIDAEARDVLLSGGPEVPNSWGKLTKTDVGLEQVDNTADIDKPVSSATQSLINAITDAMAQLAAQNDLDLLATAVSNLATSTGTALSDAVAGILDGSTFTGPVSAAADNAPALVARGQNTSAHLKLERFGPGAANGIAYIGADNLGLVFYKSDLTVLARISNAGRLSLPLHPRFCATDGVPITVSGTQVYVKPATVRYNIGGGYNPATGIFTVPVAGDYNFRYHSLNQAATAAHMQLLVNGAYVQFTHSNYAGYSMNVLDWSGALSAGDTVGVLLPAGYGEFGTQYQMFCGQLLF